MAFCPNCGSSIPAGATACAACASAGQAAAPAAAPVAGLTDNLAGLLAYLLVPAIVFLVVEPYSRNRFIRFHAFQCIFLAIAFTVLGVVVSILWHIPFLGWLVLIVLWPLISIGELILWIVLMLKAYQGQKWKLPLIGDMADKQANAI